MFENITWQFATNDRGTHSGNYFDKLQQLVTGYNVVIDGVNAQLAAGEDSAALKAEIVDIRDVALVDITELRNETLTYRNQAFAVSIGDITGADVDFIRVRVNGLDVALAQDINEMDNTSDLDKPLSNLTLQALETMQADITIVKQIARSGVISWA